MPVGKNIDVEPSERNITDADVRVHIICIYTLCTKYDV